MAVTQYIGARYVPVLADPLEWSSANAYEPLTIVTYQGDSYTSRQAVPVGVAITNEDFWACTGNYNAQIEAYRQEVARIAQQLGTIETTAGTAASDAQSALEKIGTGFDSTNTVRAAVDAINTLIGTLPEGMVDIGSALTSLDTEVNGISNDVLSGFDSETPVKTYIDEQDQILSNALEEVGNSVSRILRNPSAYSEPAFAVESRHFRPTGYSIVQGFCVFEQSGTKYWAQAELASDSDGQLNIYELTTHNLVGTYSGNLGHVHGITYIDGKLYLDSSLPNANDVYVPSYTIINVANPATPSLVTYSTVATSRVFNRLCFKSETEIYLLNTSTYDIYLHDTTTDTEEYVCTLTPAPASGVTIQNISYDANSNVFIIGTYHAFGVCVYDTSGNRINVIQVPMLVYHTRVEETEGAMIHDSKLYVNFSESSGRLRLTTLVSWDIAHGSSMFTHEVKPASSTNDIYYRCSVTDDGSLVTPTQNAFLLAQDAVNLMRYYKQDFQLRIHILKAEYSYPITLNGVHAQIIVDENAITMHAYINLTSCDVTFTNLSRMTFDGATAPAAVTDAVTLNGCRVTVGQANTVSSPMVNCILAEYNTILNITQDTTFSALRLVNSIAFAFNQTNFSKMNSHVIVSS